MSDNSQVEVEKEEESNKNIDPQSQEKILEAKERFNRKLKAERPRLAMVFTEMSVSGHTISVSVPSHTLEEEILRNKTEVLNLLAVTANVTGIIELVVNVVETVTGIKPIKIEDKIKFLTEKNPLLAKLRREMDLDIE